MIVTGQMQQAVQDKVRRVGFQRYALGVGLAGASLMGKGDIAQKDRGHFMWATLGVEMDQIGALQHGKAEHVGGLVTLPPFAIEFMNARVAGEQQACDKARIGEFGRYRLRRFCHLLRQHVPLAARPVFNFDFQFHLDQSA